jgi:hypothetical protein
MSEYACILAHIPAPPLNDVPTKSGNDTRGKETMETIKEYYRELQPYDYFPLGKTVTAAIHAKHMINSSSQGLVVPQLCQQACHIFQLCIKQTCIHLHLLKFFNHI